ncbi:MULTISPECIES: phasin family protein [Clostridium]|uniref:Phasin family protein n=1 Tax=Clostridium cibarium TaxID=2762247 RepID=A0ABR8PRW5_9CLOT|nr:MULTISPECIES: phasin family protein [Clostridium]MBD7910920.1 phasin family protein [Clostridium cibarium]
MVNDAKKIFLAGVGAAAMTYEKASEVVSTLVEKGKLTVDEGKELSEELKREVKSSAEEVKEKVAEKIKPLTREDLRCILEEMNYATKSEILELQRRIEVLEQKNN